MKLASFLNLLLVVFCSLFILFKGLGRVQNTKGFEMQMNN